MNLCLYTKWIRDIDLELNISDVLVSIKLDQVPYY